MYGRSQGPGTGGAGAGRSSQPRLDNFLPEHFPGRGGGRGRGSGGSDAFTQGASQFPALAQKITSLSSSLTAGQQRSGRGTGASAGLTESPSHFPALVRTNVISSSILTSGQQPSGRGSGRGRGSDGSAVYTGNTSLSHFPCPSAPSSLLTREVEQLSLENKAPTPVQVYVLPVVQAPSPMVQSQLGGEIVQAPPASSKALRFPTRPGFGIVGRKCTVRANHFLVHVGDKDLHHYDISITPEVASKNVCREIMSKLSKLYRDSHLGKRQLAYDGRKSVYTAGPLPFTSKEFVFNLDNASGRKEREFKVIIKFAAKADLHHLQQFLRSRQADVPQETIQALDVVLRDSPSRNYEVIGRSFFHLSFDCGPLDGGLIYWKGFYQSLRPTQMGLSLNIDVSARAFFDPILVSEFVLKHFNKDLSRPLSDQDRVKLKRALKGLRVQLDGKEDVKRYKIQGISTKPICELKFSLDNCGTEMSVMQYYREKYDTLIKYKNLPALNAGTDAKPVYLPMEIYKIVAGQRYTKKLSEKQVSAMLKATCQRPTERENSIRKIAITNKYDGDDVVEDFAIDVSKELALINARVIPPPMLKYHETGRQKTVSPHIGQWNMIDMKMVNGGRIDFWTFINFSRHKPEMLDRFCQDLVAMCYSKGMAFNCAPVCPIYSADPRNIENVVRGLNEQCRAEWRKKNPEKGLQLLIVILPEISGSYGRIKRVCETELGIISQCCQPKNVLKLNKQYMENVALKINVKAGGRNNVLADAINRRIPLVTDRPTIIIGADVTHPSPGEDSSASIAAVVGSMDWPEITKYRALVSAQNHREEIIQDLYKKEEDAQKGIVHKGMIRELLISFKKTTGYKPHRIIFYRDGVSEGQFNQVLLYEIDAIRKACCSLEENYLPPITFVVVQKRHHTRLFPSNHHDRNATDKSGNILPGTIVESSICHPTEFDFYLCSHSGIQGTSRPTHYHVLFDENKFTSDTLQTLTYNLCYTFARCTRSVSIVPPAYYAHLVAFRARYYVEGEGDSESSSVGVGQATREKNTEIRPLPAIKDNVRDVMFYC